MKSEKWPGFCNLQISPERRLGHMEPLTGHDQNADQIAFWNGLAGQHWTDRQPAQDTILAPVSDILIDRAKARAGERIVDVGCGCGATTIALAQKSRLDRSCPRHRYFGADVGPRAANRTGRLAGRFRARRRNRIPVPACEFRPPGLAVRRDVLAEPALSFGNMRRALRPSARLAFACWREPRENPWMMAPLQAAYQHVPKLPQLGPDDPGPFSFASQQRVTGILDEAGFRE